MACVLTIAAADPSGGAGIQADLSTFQEFNLHGQSIITGVTAQNHSEFIACEAVSKKIFLQQLDAIFNDEPPSHIKIGALINEIIVSCLIDFLSQQECTVICDPVIQSSSGGTLLSNNALDLFKKKLLPLCDVLTPNIPEAEILLHCQINTNDDIQQAAEQFLKLGVKNILIKGGHADSDLAADYFQNKTQEFWIYNKRINAQSLRGTGCILSSAITAALAQGEDIENAVTMAKTHLNSYLRLCEGACNVSSPCDLPKIAWTASGRWRSLAETGGVASSLAETQSRQQINPGLYAIVDSFDWVKRCVRHQVKLIQLRIKDGDIENQIKQSIEFCKKHKVQLFINDYWQLAIKHNAFGVHLGQEDLNTADIRKIKHHNIALGISTHCPYEIARARHHQPDYIAFGPIFHTDSKQMKFGPRGLEQLQYWRDILKNTFIVAIGGINLTNIDQVLATGVNSTALLSAITKAEKPYKAIQRLTGRCHAYLKTPIISERYMRQMSLPSIGITGQHKIKKATILIIGAGGLGCPALLYLSAAGVGTIGIIDGDQIEESNLSRQILFNQSDLYKNKAIIAAEKCRQQNPNIKITAYDFFLNKDKEHIINSYDIIVDCTDNFDARYLINDACQQYNKPLVFAAVNQMQGMLAVFNGENNLRDIFPDKPTRKIANCSEAGILGTTTGIIGTMQAQEAINVVLGKSNSLFISIDTQQHRYHHIRLTQALATPY